MSRFNLESLEHRRNDARLAHGLAITDRERDILVTLIEKCIRNEIFPRHTLESRQEIGICNSATPKIKDQSYLSCRRRHPKDLLRDLKAP